MAPKSKQPVLRKRGPSAALAKQALKKRHLKQGLKEQLASTEAKSRAKGGYGRAVVSIYDAPEGGIKNSPAWRKMCTHCEVDAKGRPPPPELRDGAPLKGGFPLSKYPVNVLVDGYRAPWLPDDWAQVIKNTGPGGTYLGWMSPEGKFFYHRQGYPSAIEPTLGRKLTIFDGLNGLMRRVRNIVKPGADKAFLKQCLSSAEQKHIAPAKDFLFAVVSARRASTESGQHDIMVIEGHFKQVGVRPTWYVDEASVMEYRAMGLNAKVGGKLTPARNLALDDAKAKKLVCVQVSDDISKWTYYDIEKQDFRGETDFKKINDTLLGSKRHCVSPLAAAQFILAKMRADPGKPRLGGVFPTGNAAMSMGSEEYGNQHFILGDFFVAEPVSPCRFDTKMTLKEDYDYTCSHISTHGSVLRCNRMVITVKHATNVGGAVDARDQAGEKERQNIAILQSKWPGVFSLNGRRKASQSEVVMCWKRHRTGGDGDDAPNASSVGSGAKKKMTLAAASKLKKTLKPTKSFGDFSPTGVLRLTKKLSKSEYINARCRLCDQKTVAKCLGMPCKDSKGNDAHYRLTDLKYDVTGGYLEIRGRRREA